MAAVLARRVFLAWFGGAVAGLVGVSAEARPRPRVKPYADTYSATY